MIRVEPEDYVAVEFDIPILFILFLRRFSCRIRVRRVFGGFQNQTNLIYELFMKILSRILLIKYLIQVTSRIGFSQRFY